MFLSQSARRIGLPEDSRPSKGFSQAGWTLIEVTPCTLVRSAKNTQGSCWAGCRCSCLSSPAVCQQASASATPTSRPYSTGSTSTHRRPSATLIAWELLRTQGLSGLYRGLGATLLR